MKAAGVQKQHFLAAVVWVALLGLCYLYFDARARPAARLVGNDEIVIPRAPDGHFYVTGRIGGAPLTFLVDTGASGVSIDRRTAQRLGLGAGRAATFATAGGTVDGALVPGLTVEVGQLQVQGISVGVVPDMGGGALLGQNFLRHLDVRMRDDAMVLRARTAP